MIVLLEPDAGRETVEAVLARVRGLGLDAVPLDAGKGKAFEVLGKERGRVLQLRGEPGVARILTRRRALTGGEPVWPHFALRVFILAIMLMVLLVLLTAFLPPALGDRADPGGGGIAPRVEWYLRPLDFFLGLFAEGPLGGSVVMLLWVGLFFWPFLDRVDESTPAGRRTVALVRIMVVSIVVFLVVVVLVT